MITSNKDHEAPLETLTSQIEECRHRWLLGKGDQELPDAYRELLRAYLARVAEHDDATATWLPHIQEALGFLGGQPDRSPFSLRDYDENSYGPYLGVSDEGSAAMAIRRAAHASPKAQALGASLTLKELGVALDAERLGSIGELPVGPDEYAAIWAECAGRLLISTNVGARANVRLYKRAPLVTIPHDAKEAIWEATTTQLTEAIRPFLKAPGGPRPLVVFVEFQFGAAWSDAEQLDILRSLVAFVQTGGVAEPKIQHLGLHVRIGWDAKGRDAVLHAIGLASAAGIRHLAVDGVVRKEADAAASLPGLLNYLPADLIVPILQLARERGVQVSAANVPDPDSVAREIWAGLQAARALGLQLGKYGLFPLSLEACDYTVGLIQRWFGDWTAAPVFFLDQGLISAEMVFAGDNVAQGCEAWLHVMAKHQVRVALLDTVDKSKGWKILKTGDDPKGLLTSAQIAHLDALGKELGIKLLWAGGITMEQVPEFGRLGVFGIYVTTAVSEMAPVRGTYLSDPGLASEKEPTYAGVAAVKALLEGGFLLERLKGPAPEVSAKIADAGTDPIALSGVLPEAWQCWWTLKKQPAAHSL